MNLIGLEMGSDESIAQNYIVSFLQFLIRDQEKKISENWGEDRKKRIKEKIKNWYGCLEREIGIMPALRRDKIGSYLIKFKDETFSMSFLSEDENEAFSDLKKEMDERLK